VLTKALGPTAISIGDVAKKFGKRRKPGAGDPGEDPRDLFGSPQLPRHAGRPASSTPLADYLARDLPGVDSGYVVLPRSLAETMSLPWQQQLAGLLAQFHEVHDRLNWPVYRVVPSRYENLVDLDEEQLAEAGFLVEMDAEGEMTYRERSGRKVEDPQNTTVLVSSLDPIPRPEGGGQRRPPANPPAARPPEGGQARPPAPMNIGPQPVWTTTPKPPQPSPQRPPAEPPKPPESARPAPPPPAWQPAPPDAARAWSAPHQPKPPEMSAPPTPPAEPAAEKTTQPSEKPETPKPEAPKPEEPLKPAEAVEEAPKPPAQPEKPEPRAEPPKPRSTIQQHLEQPAERHPQSSSPREAAEPPEPPKQAEAPKPAEPPKQTPTPSAFTPPVPPRPNGWVAQPPQRPADPDSDTPPRGIPQPPEDQPKERGWFDDYTDEAEGSDKSGGSGESGEGGEFGPTGEPTEIPYRYRR
jgi:hypothetical protein